MGAGASVNHPAGNGKQSVHRVSSNVSGFVTHLENNLHSLFPNAHLQVFFFVFFVGATCPPAGPCQINMTYKYILNR